MKSAPVTGIWFAAPESQRPEGTSMGRLHPDRCPLEERENPAHWIEAYHVETDLRAALKRAALDADRLRMRLHDEGGDVDEDASSVYAPVMIPVRIHEEGIVEFSDTDLLDALARRRDESHEDVLLAAENDEIREEEIAACLEDALFRGAEGFRAEPRRIYAACDTQAPGCLPLMSRQPEHAGLDL